MYRAKFETEGVFVPDALLLGNAHLLVGRVVTIKEGQNLLRGAVIGKDGEDKYLLSVLAADDGSEVPDMILGEDCDATGGDREAIAYERGDFNSNALSLGAGHTVDGITEGLRIKGIMLDRAVPA